MVQFFRAICEFSVISDENGVTLEVEIRGVTTSTDVHFFDFD